MAKKYLLLMLNKDMPMEADPEKMKAGVQMWKDWMAPLAQSGKLQDGMPTMREGKAVRKRSMKDYKPRTNDVAGYCIITADSMEEALKIAQSSPHARMNMGTTIVRECMNVM